MPKEWVSQLRYFWQSIRTKAYWRYALISRAGVGSFLAVFGGINLFVQALDFFNLYARDKYAPYSFWVFVFASALVAVAFRRPVTSVAIKLPGRDICIEVRIGDLFEATGAVVISTNSAFEADVANGKIAADSLQGQFTTEYYPGDQSALIENISEAVSELGSEAPHPMGTVVPIHTHGKTFYFTVMADLNENGNAKTTVKNVKRALAGLWAFVRESGELQELAVPVIGTGRGRMRQNRKRTIAMIADSFVDASREGKISEKLIIVAHPNDAKEFEINLWEIKAYLDHSFST